MKGLLTAKLAINWKGTWETEILPFPNRNRDRFIFLISSLARAAGLPQTARVIDPLRWPIAFFRAMGTPSNGSPGTAIFFLLNRWSGEPHYHPGVRECEGSARTSPEEWGEDLAASPARRRAQT
jgi:hypothetical protein